MSGSTSDPAFTVDTIAVSKLIGMASPYNPRNIDESELAALKLSLQTYGVVEPIVVNRKTKRIVGGHQRVRAAHDLGRKTLPVVWVTLTEAEEKKLNLALNRIQGVWDETRLGQLLAELKSAGEDLTPEPPDKPVSKPGDLYILGNHRLLCARAEDPAVVARLLDGAVIDLVNTDPPYNVNVEPRSNNAIAAAQRKGKHQQLNADYAAKPGAAHHRNFDLARNPRKLKPTGKMRARDRVLENDFLPPEEFTKLLVAWFAGMAEALKPGGAFYIWGGYANLFNYPPALEAVGNLFFSQSIIWNKVQPVLTRKDFMGQHEQCFYGWKKGAAHYFNPGITNARDLWEVQKVSHQKMVHLTEKPLELAERALLYSSRGGENVLDLFGGSGSTLIAAEKMGRCAFLMECDPAYCDVIVGRWEKFTNGKAKRHQAKAA